MPNIKLYCTVSSQEPKWERSIERIKEGNWVIYMYGSKREEGRSGVVWVSYGGKIRGKAGLGKILTVLDKEVKGITEALTD